MYTQCFNLTPENYQVPWYKGRPRNEDDNDEEAAHLRCAFMYRQLHVVGGDEPELIDMMFLHEQKKKI